MCVYDVVNFACGRSGVWCVPVICEGCVLCVCVFSGVCACGVCVAYDVCVCCGVLFVWCVVCLVCVGVG